MGVDLATVVRNSQSCDKNRVKLRKHWNRLKLFPATCSLESVAIDILGPLPRTRSRERFLLIITDSCTKPTQVAMLAKISARVVAVPFLEVWVFKYGIPVSLSLHNDSQLAAKFFQLVCRSLGIISVYTVTYHPQTIGQVERYNHTVTAMSCNYVNEHPND